MEDFTPLKPPSQWKQHHNNDAIWRRDAIAGENLWVLRPKEFRKLFLGGDIVLSNSVPNETIVTASRRAWKRLVFRRPEMMILPFVGGDGKRELQYETRNNPEVVNAWLWNSLVFNMQSDGVSFESMRYEIDQKSKSSVEARMTCLYIALPLAGPVLRFNFLFSFDHLITDGIGARILAGEFFHLLTEELVSRGTPSRKISQDINWDDSKNNLSPPWTSLLPGEQQVVGVEYRAAVTRQHLFLLSKMPNNWGLPLSPSSLFVTSQPPSQEHYFHAFTPSQTSALLHAVKLKLSLTSTITHLGHAAMVVAMIRANPIPSNLEGRPQPLHSPCWLNGRRCLPIQFAKHYVPICQGMGEIIFPDLQAYRISPTSSNDKVRKVLLKACQDAGSSYHVIKNRKWILAETLSLMEHLAKLKYQQRHEPQTTNSQVQERADPFLLSDGITEQYIDRTYFDAVSNKPVFQINELKFAANSEGPNLIVRLSSWRDILTLSAEWRSDNYERGFVERYVQDIVMIMLLLVEE